MCCSGDRTVTKEVFLEVDEVNTKKDVKEAAQQQVGEGNSLDDIVRSLHKCSFKGTEGIFKIE